ncbi:hypothetical protein J4G33_14760 [Actinotalea sp. BY-33]|uniref:Uncharacterized protein n=1 Tax=Actinotalea soli TaxID=2819234 RepID=A0A939RXC0_9CELL|nr:hypothetical protein [Actinotalea soli]MBO1753071.1 hypothetical protein [Actinotalea soli]
MSTPTPHHPIDEPGRDAEQTPATEPATGAPTTGAPTTQGPTTGEQTTGQHAAPRPYPPSAPITPAPRGEDPATAGATSTPYEGTAVLPAQSATHDTTGAPAPSRQEPTVPQGPATPPLQTASTSDATHETRRSAAAAERREIEAPSKPGFGRHLLGVLLGLVLTPVALLLVGIGTARLADVAGTSSAGTDALGLTLLIIGVVLLAVIVLLGTWSPAVPLTGGLVWGLALGIAYLVVPGIMDDAVTAMTGTRVLPAAVEQLTTTAMSGQLLVTGTLLVAAGIAAGRARRLGRRWAEGVAAAEAARAEQAREDQAITA